LVLEGELSSPWVAELKREWSNARHLPGGLPVIVDLRNVVTISQEVEHVLLEMMREGVRFICGGVLNRHILQKLTRKVAQ
jgi:hypothetical protein